MAQLVAVEVPCEPRTWTVLGADHLQVAVVEEFLEHQRADGASVASTRVVCDRPGDGQGVV